jgi:hypothetical protein
MERLWATYGRIMSICGALDTVEEEAIQEYLRQELPTIASEMKQVLFSMSEEKAKALDAAEAAAKGLG